MIEEGARPVRAGRSCDDGAAMSSEDWRVEARLADNGAAERLHTAAGAAKLYEHARRELYGRAALSHDENRVLAYTDTREHAEAAQAALEALAATEALAASYTIERWHPLAERWEDADAPRQSDAQEAREGEAAELELDRADSARTGVPEWEVRVTLAKHADAVALARKLAAEGIPTQRHWTYLLVGAFSEQEAEMLAERIRGEAPEGSAVRVEGTMAYVLSHEPHGRLLAANPFVLF
jgi:hypothetical protein